MKLGRGSMGLSSIIGALIVVLILVNSVVIIERYSSYEVEILSEHAKAALPSMLRAYSVGDSKVIVYNGDNVKHEILYIIMRNGSVKTSNIYISPGQSTECDICNDAVALILEDSHIVYVDDTYSYQVTGSSRCLRLMPNIQVEVGNSLSRVMNYEIEPALNSVIVRERYKQGSLGLQSLDKDFLSQGYKVEIAPLTSNGNLYRDYTIEVSSKAAQLIVNISDSGIKTSQSGEFISYTKSIETSYNGVQSLSLYPVEYGNDMLSFDDEKYCIRYNLSFSYYMRYLELYVNGKLYDVIRENGYSVINRNIFIIISRYNWTHLNFFLSDSQINYTVMIPIGNIAIHWSGKNDVQEQVSVKVIPDVIINLDVISEYYFKVKGDSKGFVKTRVSMYPYTIYLYNNNIMPLEGDFKLEGKGSIFYDNTLGKSIIAEYVYYYPASIEVVLSSYVAILALYYTGYSYDGLIYIYPLTRNTTILELYHNTTDNTLQGNVYTAGKSVTGIFKMLYGFRSLYIYTPDSYEGYLIYNYIDPAGNAWMFYPRLLGSNDIILNTKIFTITDKTRLSLNQYTVMKGNLSSIEICLYGITGVLEAKGEPGSKFLLVIPRNYHLSPSLYATMGDSYAILTIPQSGTLRINVTIEPATPPT